MRAVTGGQKPRGRWLPRLGCVLLLALMALWATHVRWLPVVARHLDVSEPPSRVDTVFLLCGDMEVRPFAAAAVYNKGYARRVIITNAKPMAAAEQGLTPWESEVNRRILVARGVPEDAVVMLPQVVDSTRDEARALAAYMADHPDETVGLVTSGYHTRRTRLLLRQELERQGRGDDLSRVKFFGAPTEGFGPADWWRSDHGFRAYLLEYVKLIRNTLGD